MANTVVVEVNYAAGYVSINACSDAAGMAYILTPDMRANVWIDNNQPAGCKVTNIPGATFGQSGNYTARVAYGGYVRAEKIFYVDPSQFAGAGGYNCVSGQCTPAPSGTVGQYPNLSSCQLSCTAPPPTAGYNCVNGNCQYVSSGAQYSTLSACQLACTAPPPPGTPGYICSGGTCTYVTSGAQYSTLAACQAACTIGPPPPTTCLEGQLNLMGACIPKSYVIIGGVGLLLLTLLKK